MGFRSIPKQRFHEGYDMIGDGRRRQTRPDGILLIGPKRPEETRQTRKKTDGDEKTRGGRQDQTRQKIRRREESRQEKK